MPEVPAVPAEADVPDEPAVPDVTPLNETPLLPDVPSTDAGSLGIQKPVDVSYTGTSPCEGVYSTSSYIMAFFSSDIINLYL